DPERRIVGAERVDRRVGRGDPLLATPAELGIGDAIAVRVGPAVEAAAHDAVELARREVVAEEISAVVGGEELVRSRLPVESDGVPKAGREDLALASVGAEAEQGSASRIVFEARVAAGPDGDVHPAVRPE